MSSSSESPGRIGLVLCEDLMFTSRITGTARALGLVVKPVRTLARLEELAQELAISCLILDLAFPGLEVQRARAQVAERIRQSPRLVAFGSHVDAKTLHAARAGGCDLVLTRSQFVERLPVELADWIGVNP